jgi:hypothetical protein
MSYQQLYNTFEKLCDTCNTIGREIGFAILAWGPPFK